MGELNHPLTWPSLFWWNVKSFDPTKTAVSPGDWQANAPEMGGTLKWMVFVREKPTKVDDLGVPLFQETTIYTTIVDSI